MRRKVKAEKFPLAAERVVVEFKLRRAKGCKISKLWLKKKMRASVESYIRPLKAQITMKGECFKEILTTVTRKEILCNAAQSKTGRVIRLVGTPGVGRKVQGAAHCAEKQNLGDQFPEEALPTSHEFGGSN